MAAKRVSALRTFVIVVNIASTLLTLFAGLRENPAIVLATGRYDYIRARLKEGYINYDIVRGDLLHVEALANLTDVGANYRFISAPTRTPSNLQEDRSTCMRVNSMNVTAMSWHYNDYWGTNARRTQVFMYSISAPHCQVVNFRTEWVEGCIVEHTNASACHQYIFDNFDELLNNRPIQAGVEVDFGEVGIPFLKCLGRPERGFEYITDLMVHQSFWAGGSYHVEIQSSNCHAVPLLRDSEWNYGLFQAEAVDEAADVVVAIDHSGWFASIVTTLYGLASLMLIVRGIGAAALRYRAVLYVPSKLRFPGSQRLVRYVAPFMPAAMLLAEDPGTVVRLKGVSLMASNFWLNHWLYISLSIGDSLVSIRMIYVVLEMGTWMLNKSANAENFIFLLSTLTRITWLTCFVHSVLRLLLKTLLNGLKAFQFVRPALRLQLEQYVDASAMFMSYKLYSVMLCTLMFILLTARGTISFMALESSAKRAVLGGSTNLADFWHSEIMCDLVTIICILLFFGIAIGYLILLTPLRYAATNGVMQLLQRRYVFVGWDAMVAMEALGIDPFDPRTSKDGVALANCSFGCIVQQMFQSGPSGLVNFAGDYIFEGGAFSRDPVLFRFDPKHALRMGLVVKQKTTRGKMPPSTAAKYATTNTGASNRDEVAPDATNEQKGLFDRRLRVVTESLYGRILLIDVNEPGKFGRSDDGLMEYTVRDALSYMNILEIKHLLSNTRQLKLE